MCLILFALDVSPAFPLVLAANRDEFYNRLSRPMNQWDQAPGIIAGKDVSGGGTWMGVHPHGRFAALTNFRAPALQKNNAPSRGEIILDLLADPTPIPKQLKTLEKRSARYNGFNLLSGNIQNKAVALHWYSNQGPGPTSVPPGLHGLSNALLDTPWPKVNRGKRLLENQLQICRGHDDAALLSILTDTLKPDDGDLPDTGVGLEWERILSPLFIQSPSYGTRCSTLMKVDTQGNITLIERSYHKENRKQFTDRKFTIPGPDSPMFTTDRNKEK